MFFYMEKQLEDFLVANWEKTALGERFELIEENGNLVSQQYRTDIGTIDILARDRKDGAYVVIELKRNQSSDDTVGQVLRYMGWFDEHKKMGKPTRCIIIARAPDRKLDYALRRIGDVQTYIYKVNFQLMKLKK
jgi:restriction system protein